MTVTNRAMSMTSTELQENMLGTYFSLRLGLVVLSIALPVLLYGYSVIKDGGLTEGSISAFYGAYGSYMRNGFVGILWSVGWFLVGYKGFSPAENWLLNAAGLSAVLLSIVPCNCWSSAIGEHNPMHFVFAISFFIAMASVCLFCANQTISLLPKDRQPQFTTAYRVIGIMLGLSPAAAIVFSYALNQYVSRTFYIEAFAVTMFSAYWVAKSLEFRLSSAEKRAARGELKTVPGRGVVPADSLQPIA